MGDRETLQELRRLDELQSRAGGATAVAEPEQPASMTDKLIGGRGGRLLMGMASPLVASAQLGAHVGDAINTATGVEPVVSPWIDAKLKDLEASKQRGMKALGNEGFDAYGLIGSLIPGAAIAKEVATALPAATGALGRIGTGAAIGAATSAAQPVTPTPDFFTEKGKQVGIGGAIGGAIPAVGEAVRAARGMPNLNPVKAATLAEGQAAGYVVPPSTVNPSFLNNRLESIAGKASVGQEAAKRNQEVTNALAAKELGLPPNTDITPGILKDIRKDAGKVYKEVDALRSTPTYQSNLPQFPQFTQPDLLGDLKRARADARLAYQSNTVTPHPDMLARAQVAEAKANQLEGYLENVAKANGRGDLIDALAKARTTIAKTYDVQNALNEADASVSAPVLGKAFDKRGSEGLTGNLGTIGKFQQAFRPSMREGAMVPSSGVSGTDAAASALLATAGAAGGGPMGLLAGGLPLLRGPARNLVLSPAYQKFATSDPTKYQTIIDALAQQGAGAAGTTAGRLQP